MMTIYFLGISLIMFSINKNALGQEDRMAPVIPAGKKRATTL
jgi:hypothetical protein